MVTLIQFLVLCALSQFLCYLGVFAVLKGIVHSKMKTVIIYLPSCHSKPDYLFEKQITIYLLSFRDWTLLYKLNILPHMG